MPGLKIEDGIHGIWTGEKSVCDVGSFCRAERGVVESEMRLQRGMKAAVEFREKWNLSSVMETIERSLDTLRSLICRAYYKYNQPSCTLSTSLMQQSRYFENVKYFRISLLHYRISSY